MTAGPDPGGSATDTAPGRIRRQAPLGLRSERVYTVRMFSVPGMGGWEKRGQLRLDPKWPRPWEEWESLVGSKPHVYVHAFHFLTQTS